MKYKSYINSKFSLISNKYINLIGDEVFKNYKWEMSNLAKSKTTVSMYSNKTSIVMKEKETTFYLVLSSYPKNFKKINFDNGIDTNTFDNLELGLHIDSEKSNNNKVTLLLLEYDNHLSLINKIKYEKNIINIYKPEKNVKKIALVIEIKGQNQVLINGITIKSIENKNSNKNNNDSLTTVSSNKISYYNQFKSFLTALEEEKNHFSKEAYNWKRKALEKQKQKTVENNSPNSFTIDILNKLANSIPVSNGINYYKKLPYKVAIISDIYMFNYYKDTFDEVYYLSPDNYQDILNNKIDMVIYVSCWKGINDEEWRGVKFREKPSQALEEIIQHSKKNDIKLVFQTIEDPSNFDYFIPIAKKFDFIFTSDIDMISKYKEELKHNNVFYGEYGFNPIVNNPIASQRELINGAFFAGSYTKRYEERCKDMEILLDSILESTDTLIIADRNINITDENLKYPSKYSKYLIPPVEHQLLQKMHKLFRFNLNFNSIKYSPTMCAMRVYELQAQATNLISNYSMSLLNKFPNVRVLPVKENFEFDLNNNIFEYEIKIDSLREVLSNKTSFDICRNMLDLTGLKTNFEEKNVLILYSGDENIEESIKRQNYKKLIFLNINIINSIEKWNETIIKYNIQYFTYFSKENNYEENYINDMVSAFKYTDANYITKNSYFYKGIYKKDLEHEFTDYINGVDKTLFRVDKYNHFDLEKYQLDEKIENMYNGYAIDPFELNYTNYLSLNSKKKSVYKLSVIIPIYNNGKYLKYKCLNSLMKNKKWNEFEILLVDDGSTDLETITITKKLESQYENIKTFFFNDGGSGSASRPRNKGIEIASGDLITFLDPDNEISPGGYDNLINIFDKNNVDFVSGYNIKVDKEVKTVAKHTSLGVSVIEGFKEKYFKKGRFPTIATQAAVISSKFLKENNELRFVEKSAGQDTLFGWELLLKSEKGAFTSSAFLIYYADRMDSVTNTLDSKYFEKKLILEKEQVKILKKNDLLNIYKKNHFDNFMNNWYLKKLELVDEKNKQKCKQILEAITNLYY